ncbi:MAG: rhomboid family intramembrane serine protease [Alphaproteobacteria bacterium]
MFPLGDASRQPARFPAITIGFIVVNALVFVLELTQGDAFIQAWSLIPAEFAAGHRPETLLTSMFLHGGWSHIIGNMVFLWAFGPQIEDAMGMLRYLAFYLLGGAVAMAAQVFMDPASTIPNLGASGAIAAVMGAFLVTYPRDRIKTIVFLGVFTRITFIPAMVLIGVWFLMQLVSVGAITSQEGGGVAYTAHIAGAIFGAATAWFFEDRARIGLD